MQEIDNFASNMDDVKTKGSQVIETSSNQPQFIQHTKEQLANLDDSYLSLQATSEQIKVSRNFDHEKVNSNKSHSPLLVFSGMR